MAFSSSFRRLLNGSSNPSSSLCSQFRLNSTLTTPRLYVTGFSSNVDAGFSRNITDEKLRNAFKKFGEIVEATVTVDKESGISQGYGFVEYKTIKEAEKAMKGMSAKLLDGCVIFVEPDKTPKEG